VTLPLLLLCTQHSAVPLHSQRVLVLLPLLLGSPQ
jgi:hypothetical protein